MEFIDKINLQGKSGFFYKGIEFDNNIELSVQASNGHYCKPKFSSNTTHLEDYAHMEFALFHDDNFCTVQNILPNFSRLDEIENYRKNGSVYGYVPVELIECLYQELKSTYGLKGEK